MRVTFDTPTEPHALVRALWGFVLASQAILRAHPELPPLYQSGVRYKREPPGRERWQTVEQTLARLEGDCEDLTIARVAELRERGVDARPHVYRARSGTLHAVVRLPDGRIEDPSRKLGMGRKANTMAGEAPKAKVSIDESSAGYTSAVSFRGAKFEVIIRALGDSKVESTEKAATIARKIVEAIERGAPQDPALASLAELIPPQAKAAIKVASALVKVARKGGLGKALGKLRGPALKLGRALASG